MPSATATLYLNLTAIQQLCKGDPGKSILNGTVAPTSAVGLSGDFYFNTFTTYPPVYYDLYGPKIGNTTSWPSTAIRIPSTTLLSQISSTLNSAITALSAQTSLGQSVSSLNIANTNYATNLTVSQGGSQYGYNVAKFSDTTGTLLTISNSGGVSFFYGDPTVAPAKFSVNSPAYFAGNLSAIGDLYANGNLNIYNNLRYIVGTLPSGSAYNILTLGPTIPSGTGDTGFNVLTTFSAFLSPNIYTYDAPVRVHNTRFEVGMGSLFASTLPNNGAFFIVDPVSAYGAPTGGYNRGVTIHGTITALSGYFQYLQTSTLSSVTIIETTVVGASSFTSALSTNKVVIGSSNPIPVAGINTSPLSIAASTTGSVYNTIVNTFAGVSASTDIALYNNDLVNYVDLGIASTAYNGNIYSPKFNVVKAGDSYLYSTSSNMVIGTTNASTGDLVFFTGGALSGTSINSGNERMRILNSTATSNAGYVGFNTSTPNQQVTIYGGMSALSSFSTNYYDVNSNRILTNRQTPGFALLTAGVSTSAQLITQLNLIITSLTAHGLAI